MSAAPAITREKARKRAVMPGGAGADRVVEDDDAAEDRGEVGDHGSDHDQPGRGDRQADPLSASELKAEEALGEHGEEDEPAGEDRVSERELLARSPSSDLVQRDRLNGRAATTRSLPL
jgi:hypothetical protein